MASPHAAWQLMKLVSSHPRLRIGLLSVGGCIIFHRIFYTLWLRWLTKKKLDSRRRAAATNKETVRTLCRETEEIDLSNQTAEKLVKAIISGNLTAENVLNSFAKKALNVDDEINAVTEPVVEAWDQVKILDFDDEKNGLLHGIPLSVKECIRIGGYDCTAGMSGEINKIIVEDAIVVKVLKRQGAIPFMRTNLPQSMMSYTSSNPIYGETCNPFDKTRSPGGSSSGEGALIGGSGSIIGIGTDIGGSIRIPACFCGAYSLKTTYGRLSSKGCYNINPGRLAIQGCVGLIARDFESLVLLSKAAMSKDMWTLDPSLPQLPFDQQEYNKTEGLRIGYYTFDGNIQCQPAVVRAVMKAKEVLERKGHTLVPINFPTTFKSGFQNGNLFIRLMTADSGKVFLKHVGNDKLEKALSSNIRLFLLPRWLLQIMSLVASQLDPFLGKTLKGFYGFCSVYEYFLHVTSLVHFFIKTEFSLLENMNKQWRNSFMEAWMDNQFDAVICPTFPSPPPKLEQMHYATAATVYCQLYNSLNYPSGCIPITTVTKEDVAQALDPKIYKTKSLMEKLLLKDVEGTEGLPVGIQCAALPFREEICLRVMRDIQSELQS